MELEEEEILLLRKRKNSEESSDEDEQIDIMEDDTPIDKKPKSKSDLHSSASAVPNGKCPICFEPLICHCCYYPTEGHPNVCKLSNCGHTYCKTCIAKYFTLHIKEKRFPIKVLSKRFRKLTHSVLILLVKKKLDTQTFKMSFLQNM
jgi:hypothetical protein